MLPNAGELHSNKRPVNIHHFVKATLTGTLSYPNSLILARVFWLFPHPSRNSLGKPAELWCLSMYESFGVHSFLPVSPALSLRFWTIWARSRFIASCCTTCWIKLLCNSYKVVKYNSNNDIITTIHVHASDHDTTQLHCMCSIIILISYKPRRS